MFDLTQPPSYPEIAASNQLTKKPCTPIGENTYELSRDIVMYSSYQLAFRCFSIRQLH
jgi:hypothetical protein